MADSADNANVIVRPPIAWALAVLIGLALNWLIPLPFLPAPVPAAWLGAIVCALARVLVVWAIATMTRLARTSPLAYQPQPLWRLAPTASRAPHLSRHGAG